MSAGSHGDMFACAGHGSDHPLTFQLSVALGIQEQDKNNWIFCPTTKVQHACTRSCWHLTCAVVQGVFKARVEKDRLVHITLNQVRRGEACLLYTCLHAHTARVDDGVG